MNIPIIGPIVSGIAKLGNTWLEGKNKKMQTKAEAEAKVLVKASESVADWEAIQARNSSTSFKDEWITFLISIPLIMAFIPGGDYYVNLGFAVLGQMPDWYQYTVSVVVAASFGVRSAIGIMGKRNAMKQNDK